MIKIFLLLLLTTSVFGFSTCNRDADRKDNLIKETGEQIHILHRNLFTTGEPVSLQLQCVGGTHCKDVWDKHEYYPVNPHVQEPINSARIVKNSTTDEWVFHSVRTGSYKSSSTTYELTEFTVRCTDPKDVTTCGAKYKIDKIPNSCTIIYTSNIYGYLGIILVFFSIFIVVGLMLN